MLDDYQKTQKIIYETLKNAVDNDKLSHAYLFDATNSSLGIDLVKAFVKYIYCPNKKKCVNCVICKNINENKNPDIEIINPDSLWIKKEQLLVLQDKFSVKSLTGNKKIYIINGAEFLNDSSANTILKFLEEPEPGIIAILLSKNINNVLETIKSRCQILKILPEIKKSKTILEKVGSYLCDGEENINIFINQSNSLEKIENVLEFVNFYEKDKINMLLFIQKKWLDFFNDKESNLFGYEIMILIYKDAINYKIGRKIEIFDNYEKTIKYISDSNDLKNLYKKLAIIIENKDKIRLNINNSLNMDNLIIRLEEIK